MLTKILVALVAVAYLGNGAYMLFDPALWYARVPGVPESGPMNPHFIRDIGFAYLLSGLAFAIALRRPLQRASWIALGTAWPALHAGFHVVEWLVHGPPAAAVLAIEFVGVVVPVAIGICLAAFAPDPVLADDPTGEPA